MTELLTLLGLELQLLQHAEAFDGRGRWSGLDRRGCGLIVEGGGGFFDTVLMVKGKRGKEWDVAKEGVGADTLLFHPKRLPMKSIRTLSRSVIYENAGKWKRSTAIGAGKYFEQQEDGKVTGKSGHVPRDNHDCACHF